jgi:sec-independent protein translocase protein TatB
MFDITSSKLLILGIVALLVIGPKDLPALLRTIGKYMGIIKRQAAEFRAQFDEAMRESELADLKKDVESLGREAEQSMRAAEQSMEKELAQADDSVAAALDTSASAPAIEPAQAAADEAADERDAAANPLNGTGAHAELPASQPADSEAEAPRTGTPQVEKSGA